MQRFILLILIIGVVAALHKSNETLRKTSPSNTSMSVLFDKSDRARQLNLRKVFRDLKIRRHCKVADVGAGSGWLTVRLATFVGPKGKVYAVEILPQYLLYIKQEVLKYKLNNVETVLGSAIDPKLTGNTLDATMILIAYHEFEQPIIMLTNIRRAMKIGARLGILDRDNDRMRTDAREAYAKTGYVLHRFNETLINKFLTREHYLALNIVIQEATSVGFTFLFSREIGGDHYIAIFVNS